GNLEDDKECNRGGSVYGVDERGVLKQWYCNYDNKRRDVKGKEMLFSGFLQIRYGNSKIDDTTMARSIWEAFGGKSRDLGSIREETGQKHNYSILRLPFATSILKPSQKVPRIFYQDCDFSKHADDVRIFY
ncbi:hypothetical protein Tco_1250135, partial [Tanacetum coccineum]